VSRLPRQHRILDISHAIGLSDLLQGWLYFFFFKLTFDLPSEVNHSIVPIDCYKVDGTKLVKGSGQTGWTCEMLYLFN
jgi:hypothetical protein